MNLSLFSNAIGQTVINQLYPAQDPGLDECRRRRENIGYGIGFWLRSLFAKPSASVQVKPRCERDERDGQIARRIVLLNPQAWPLPNVQLSQTTAQEVKQLVEKRGLVYQQLTLDQGETPSKARLLSQSDLTGVDRSQPVILLAHGYTATTYEWDDLAKYIDQNAKDAIRYSQVLLGGHGRSLQDFRSSTWQEWGKPIVEEYRALVAKGFTNISLAGSSTACSLILEQLDRGAFDGKVTPNQIFMIDPIVEPSGFLMRQVIRMLALFNRSYAPTQAFSPEEFAHWYGNRPFTTLASLNDLTYRVNQALSKGIRLPRDTRLTVWASQSDPTVNPDGYQLIQKGVRGGNVSVYPINSRFHVFTRLSGRPEAKEGDRLPANKEEVSDWVKTAPIPVTRADRILQKETFDQMLKTCCSL